MKLKAKAEIDNKIIDCVGNLKIDVISNQQAYVTWQFFSGEKIIASKSENLFYNKEIDSEDDIIKKVLKRIEGYRIGRNKIFTDVKTYH